ncbi:MAG: hypothetical protein IT355_14990 [Gemmatimonadaceae bacterium]|nr:hypothetical protein [Gemmatimonadaceae bacterium]
MFPSNLQIVLTRRAARAMVAAALLTACNSDGGDAPVDPVPQGTIEVRLTPASVTLAAGSSGSVGLGVTRGGAFSGPVTLAASGQPSAMTVTFGSSPVAAGNVSTSVTVVVGAAVAPGTYGVTITGTGSGATAQPSTLTVRVN